MVTGLGFGMPGMYGTYYFATHDGAVWMLFGLPTNGDGPFVDIGIRTTMPLLIGFVVVCLAEVVVGVLLWVRPRTGGWLSIALLPFEFVYWVGFALPFGPLHGVLRTALVVPVLRDSDVGSARGS